jgi:hypothetical protein
MPQKLPLAIAYVLILAWIVVSICALFPSKPRTQIGIKVLFGVLALLVLLQIIIVGDR